MNEEVKQFIKQNIDLIKENTLEAWEQIYEKIPNTIIGNFTQTMLGADINPALILEYIPQWYLFYSNIENYNIPKNVTYISDHAFYCCHFLKSITIPDSVTKISNGAFPNCNSLTKVNYTGTIDGWAQIEFSAQSANPLSNGVDFYINDQLITTADIMTATKISSLAFAGCRSLTNVAISNSVTNIGECAFIYCTSLTSVTIGNSVTSIGDSAFDYCRSLTSVVIGDSVTSIGDKAFDGCSSLTNITVGNGVTNIGEAVFYGCKSLTEIYYNGTKKEAINCGIGNKTKKKWRQNSNIKKIICTDGVIEL